MQKGRLLRLIHTLWQTPIVLILAVVSTIGVTAFNAAIPLIAGTAVDAATGANSAEIPRVVRALILVALARYAFMFTRRYIAGRLSNMLQHNLRMQVMDSLLRTDGHTQDTLQTGQTVSRSIADLNQVQAVVAMIPLLLGHIATLIVTLVLLWWISPALMAIGLVCVPVILVVSWRSRRTLFAATWAKQQAIAKVSTQIEQTVTGVRIVKAFGQEDRETSTFAKLAQAVYANAIRAAKLTARYQPAVQQLPTVALVIGIGVGGWLAIQGEITIGVFLAFSVYLTSLTHVIGSIAGLVVQFQLAASALDRVYDVIDLPHAKPSTRAANPQTRRASQRTTPEPRSDDPADANPTGTVRVEDVHLTLGEHKVLDGLSVDVARGRTTMLVGPAGAGKSVLLSVLTGYYAQGSGTASVSGSIGVVFDDPFLYSNSVRYNIDAGRGLDNAAIERAARIAQAWNFIADLPDGLDTVVGERGLNLSGGQRQRIALARAVAGNPDVLLLDDATSAIDATTERAIYAAIATELPRTTILAVAHRHSTLEQADSIALVHRGRTVAQGSREEMERHPQFAHIMDLRAQQASSAVIPVPFDDGQEPSHNALWPTDAPRATGLEMQASTARAAASSAGMNPMSGGRGRSGGSMGAAMPATPELLARVEALPAADARVRTPLQELLTPWPHFNARVLFAQAKGLIAMVIALYALGVVAGLAIPWLAKVMIDRGVVGNSPGIIGPITAAGLGVVAVAWGAQVASTIATAFTGERLLYQLRVRCYAHLQRLGVDFYERNMSGAIMTRMTTDIDALNTFLQTSLATAVVSTTTIVGILILLGVTSPVLFGLSLIGIPIIVAATAVFRRISSRLYAQAREQISGVNAQFQEAIAGLRTTQAFGFEHATFSTFEASSRGYVRTRIKAQTAVALYFPGLSTVSELVQAGVLFFGAHMVADGNLAAGALVAFLLYLDRLYSPITSLSQVFDSYQQAQVGLRRIGEFLAEQPSISDTGTLPIPTQADLALVDVDFAYTNLESQRTQPQDPEQEAPQHLLRGFNLHIPNGATVAIVGPTGAGKSTIVKLLERFYDPTAGKVCASDTDIRAFKLAAWRRSIGYVPQEAHLFEGTVASNIAYGRPDATQEAIEGAARAVGALNAIAAIPGGFNARVGERGRGLSSGQRQLITLARAEMMKPEVMILDEATSTVDPATEATILKASERATHHRTAVVIAHRLATAARADYIYVIAGGRIVEHGTHNTLCTYGGMYARMWEDTTQENPS